MGVKLVRKKPRQIWLSVLYRLSKLPFASSKAKMKFFLNLEWAFHRFAHENSFGFYTESNHPVRARTREFLLARIKPDDVVLDLGCKVGVMSNYLASKAKRVVGVDYDVPAIEQARASYQLANLEFEAVEALEYLKKQKEPFTVLILSHILEHLDEPTEFLRDFTEYFKYIYIEVPDFDKNYMNHYRKDLGVSLVYTDDDHISEFDREELSTIIEGCNLEILKTEYRYGVQKYWCKVG